MLRQSINVVKGMIKIEYVCDKCGECESYMPSKHGGIIICGICKHQEEIPTPVKKERWNLSDIPNLNDLLK